MLRMRRNASTAVPLGRWSCLAALICVVALPAAGQVDEGDRQWALRAEGQVDGRAGSARVDAAIAAYRAAAARSAGDLESRWKLLRALRFKAQYVATTVDEKKPIYADAKKVGEEALAIIDRALAPKGLSARKSPEGAVAAAAGSIPGAAETFLWDAINWGEWALVYGKLAAVREGAAERIRRGATIAMRIDPRLEGGSPARVLGRLHDQTPRVPLLTGWASSREAVRLLRQSYAIDPANKITLLFLAEAMVHHDAGSKPQAIELLRRAVSEPNPPEFLVENAAAQQEAMALLRAWLR